MTQETTKERRERLTQNHDQAMARFVYGEAPKPVSRYTLDRFGRKQWASFEDYLNG